MNRLTEGEIRLFMRTLRPIQHRLIEQYGLKAFIGYQRYRRYRSKHL